MNSHSVLIANVMSQIGTLCQNLDACRRLGRRISFAGMLSFLFFSSTGYTLFLIAGVKLDWRAVNWILKNDDGYVAAVSRVVPLLSRYKAFMLENGYSQNVELMENAYGIAWAMFVLVSLSSLSLVRNWAQRMRSGATVTSKFITLRTAANILLVFFVYSFWASFVGFMDFDWYSIMAEKIHRTAWYALRAAVLVSANFYLLFLPIVAYLALKKEDDNV